MITIGNLIKSLIKSLFFFLIRTVRFPSGVLIEGDPRRISISKNTKLFKGAVLSVQHGGNICIGKGCEIHQGTMLLTYGGDIILGDHCSINPYTIIYGHGNVKIGDSVRIAAHTVIIPANHQFKKGKLIREQELSKNGITVEDDVWIGANVTILDKVEIGKGSVVGAGSVVTKNVQAYSIYAGNPAIKIKDRI